MARGLAEDRSRRLGRVEMLLTELEQLPDGYQPTDQEVEQFKSLVAKINAVFGFSYGLSGSPVEVKTEPEPEAPVEAPAGKLSKTENGKRKTGT
jgi:hypothetical protein